MTHNVLGNIDDMVANYDKGVEPELQRMYIMQDLMELMFDFSTVSLEKVKARAVLYSRRARPVIEKFFPVDENHLGVLDKGGERSRQLEGFMQAPIETRREQLRAVVDEVLMPQFKYLDNATRGNTDIRTACLERSMQETLELNTHLQGALYNGLYEEQSNGSKVRKHKGTTIQTHDDLKPLILSQYGIYKKLIDHFNEILDSKDDAAFMSEELDTALQIVKQLLEQSDKMSTILICSLLAGHERAAFRKLVDPDHSF